MKRIRSYIAQLSRQGIDWSSQPTENCHPSFRSVPSPIYPVRTQRHLPPRGGKGPAAAETCERHSATQKKKSRNLSVPAFLPKPAAPSVLRFTLLRRASQKVRGKPSFWRGSLFGDGPI